ncbi:flagellar hook-associated protein FlgK [Photobacterium sp. CCB-ST2H9]|uniref:flagellar hook-associated protein FlgK n=1 Tax=Photobacterium sp. CCB-ST2H9 TaxID=2912855 RepID=UPI002004B37D|nr:flagellar hook-associated protein FlgK [Photobacterium sp. CCB-ST2H9]UTM58574.1 flagellar hook-associated protein FlgK [Photobacterium sp. CCB-ST2H9]
MSIINIALSGLNANRAGLDVTAQNVANVNTPGYSRQQAMYAAVGPGSPMANSAGRGVEVTGIRRVSDEFVVKQTWATQSQASYNSRYLSNMSQLESIMGADSFNISMGLDNLYAALNDASVKPESAPLRQQIISEADALTRRFNTLSESYYSQHKDLSDQRTAAVELSNSLLVNIADVNKRIVEMSATSGNPSHLLDERDALIGQLSEMMSIKTNMQPDGSMQVTLASGQPLVIGDQASQLKAVPDATDPYLADMEIDFIGQRFPINGDIGGELGAISDYQVDTLLPFRESLDDMAVAIADAFNNTLATGQDLNGNAGQPLFAYDPTSPSSSLKITTLQPDELALSSDGTPGNSDVLTSLIGLSNQTFAVTGYGNTSISDAFTSMVGDTAIKARQVSSDAKAADSLNSQAIAVKENLSSVNSDEEAANLMVFANAYQANMKVISTANNLFDTVLAMF